MGNTRMFRDRVVSLEQTQEIGEKHIDLLKELALEALPGFDLFEHGLEHEKDLYVLTLVEPGTGTTRKVAFTRMVLSDAGRLPAVVESPRAPMRDLIVESIRAQAQKTEITVSIKLLLTEEEKSEASEIEAEWRKKHEAELALRRAEEERRERERRDRKRQDEARQKIQRERERREREKSRGPLPAGAPVEAPGGARRRRRRGGQRPDVRGPREGRPLAPPQAAAPRPAPPAVSPRPAPAGAEGPRPEGSGGGRRRRRRGRGGPRPAGGAPSGGGAPVQ